MDIYALVVGGSHILMEGETATGMAAFLEQGSALFTWVMTNLGTIVTTVTGNPLMMVGFLMTLVGFSIGIFKRLVNVQ